MDCGRLFCVSQLLEGLGSGQRRLGSVLVVARRGLVVAKDGLVVAKGGLVVAW